MQIRSRILRRLTLLSVAFVGASLVGFQCPGLDPFALHELHGTGVDKYVGQFEPASSEAVGDWTMHTFDTDGGNGPTCIDGSPFTVFTKVRDPEKVVFFLNGGGACWQDFYFCTTQATTEIPAETPGIFSDSYDTGSEIIENPLADWSQVFVSYCDGSVFSGDNDVVDANYPNGPVRYHRGLRNLTAAMDLTKDVLPHARKVMVSGASAGGVGAAGFAPFVFRFVYGNWVKLRVFNDAGPVAYNPLQVDAIEARENDWQFGQFYPDSCTDCSYDGSPTAAIEWRLKRDRTVRESFYSTDGDLTNRFFLQVPTQENYRDLLEAGHGPLNADYPGRYKRFIRSGDTSHTALGTDLYYVGTADGVPLYEWTEDFLTSGESWIDIVEDFVPAP